MKLQPGNEELCLAQRLETGQQLAWLSKLNKIHLPAPLKITPHLRIKQTKYDVWMEIS